MEEQHPRIASEIGQGGQPLTGFTGVLNGPNAIYVLVEKAAEQQRNQIAATHHAGLYRDDSLPIHALRHWLQKASRLDSLFQRVLNGPNSGFFGGKSREEESALTPPLTCT